MSQSCVPQPSDALILIPARMRSARLPGKPLADIAGQPMIVHVAMRAAAAAIGPVVVATDDDVIARTVEAAGFRAILTDADHASGSDRIAQALGILDPARAHAVVVNVQGDEPEIDPHALRAAIGLLADPSIDIATLAAPLRQDEIADPNAVKLHGRLAAEGVIHVDSFTRATPAGLEGVWRHIGVYAYRRAALERFVALATSVNEIRERLEQLRACDAGMRFAAALVKEAPRGVDTPADLAAVRERFAKGLNR